MLMKKRFFMALACAAMMLSAAAQWPVDDNAMTVLEAEQNMDYYDPTMIRKADGSSLLSYKVLGKHINPETGQKESHMYVYLYMQKLDKNGNKLLGDSGVAISYKPTQTASFSRIHMDTLANGNVVLHHEDIRPEDTTYVSPTSGDYRSYIYCYTQDGQPVWPKDGIEMPFLPQDPDAQSRRVGAEQVTVSGNNVYFTAMMKEEMRNYITPDSFVVYYPTYFEIACLDTAGHILSYRIDSVPTYSAYNTSVAPNGNLYVVYTDFAGGYSAKCFNAQCENIWGEPVVVESDNVTSKSSMGSIVSVAPKEMVLMNDSSVAIVYHTYPTLARSILFYNRLYKDGSTFAEHIRLSDTIGLHDAHECLFEGDTLTVFEARSRLTRNEEYLYYNRVLLSDGSYVLGTPLGKILDLNVGVLSKIIGVAKAEDMIQLLLCNDDPHSGVSYNNAYTYTPDGTLIQGKQILGGYTDINDRTCIFDGHYAYLFLSLDDNGKGGIWLSRVDVTDYTQSAPVTGTLDGKFTVNASGRQVQFTRGNMEYMKSHQMAHVINHPWEVLTGLNKWCAVENFINWLDLFGWGTGTDESIIQYDTLASYDTFVDWGEMSYFDGSCAPGTLRTLSAEEWHYLLNEREDAANKRTIGAVYMADHGSPLSGAILLPDEFQLPEGLDIHTDAKNFNVNDYTRPEWFQMEKNGAVFLPLTAYRKDTVVYDYDDNQACALVGHYWTSTIDGEGSAKSIQIDENGLSIVSSPRYLGMGVRLVKDAESGEGIQDIKVTDDNKTRKILMDGTLYIIRDGKVYNVTGVQVR